LTVIEITKTSVTGYITIINVTPELEIVV